MSRTPPPASPSSSTAPNGLPATSKGLPTLQAIEALVRDRELHGYSVLKELLEICTRACTAPGHHYVALHGPDTLYISRCPVAVDFLIGAMGYEVYEKEPNLVLYFSSVADEDSVDWELAKRKRIQAVAQVQWAMSYNSNLLVVKLHRLQFHHQFSAPFRIEVSLQWRNELGNVCKEDLPSSEYYDPTETTSVASPAPQPKASSSENKNVGGGEEMVRYSRLLEVLPTTCDAKCTVSIKIYRKRAVIGDKVKAIASFEYDNFGLMKEEIDLHDPDSPNGLPVGSIAVEIDSLAHKCFRIEEALRLAVSPPVKLQRTLSTEGDITPSSLPLAISPEKRKSKDEEERNRELLHLHPKEEPIVTVSLKGSALDGTKDDDDDYYGALDDE